MHALREPNSQYALRSSFNICHGDIQICLCFVRILALLGMNLWFTLPCSQVDVCRFGLRKRTQSFAWPYAFETNEVATQKPDMKSLWQERRFAHWKCRFRGRHSTLRSSSSRFRVRSGALCALWAPSVGGLVAGAALCALELQISWQATRLVNLEVQIAWTSVYKRRLRGKRSDCEPWSAKFRGSQYLWKELLISLDLNIFLHPLQV